MIMVFSAVVTTGLLSAETTKPMEATLVIGETVPEISAIGIDKKSIHLKALYGKKGLVLVLFRSADWCPYCKKHLIEINQWAEKIAQQGFQIAAISYDSPEILQQFKVKAGISFTLLADVDHRTVKNYGVLNEKYQPDHRHYGIPHPGVLVIDKEGKLLSKHFFKGYKKRVTGEAIVAELKKL